MAMLFKEKSNNKDQFNCYTFDKRYDGIEVMTEELREFLRTKKGFGYDPDFDPEFYSVGEYKKYSRAAIMVVKFIDFNEKGEIIEAIVSMFEPEEFQKKFEACSN